MTDQEMRVAIAEWCGWRRCRLGWQAQNEPEPMGWLTPQGKERSELPDFCSDLNAMHEAEKKLGVLGFQYKVALMATCRVPSFNECISATARQRAEALLRTIGRWKD